MKAQNLKSRLLNFTLYFFFLTFTSYLLCYAQEAKDITLATQEASLEAAPQTENIVEAAEPALQEQQTATVDNLAPSENVTLDFKEADIRNVLKIISYKAGVNIVTTPEVIGNVNIRLIDVPWEKAMDVILKTQGFGYDRQGNIIIVGPIDKLTSQRKQEAELAQVQPTATEVFVLKFLDATDAKKALDPLISGRGKITILEMTGQAGWEFGGTELAKRKRTAEERMGRSKTMIISDVPPVLDKIREVIVKIDIQPQQIAIETRIMEVNHDLLRDMGLDWGTGSGGAATDVMTGVPIQKNDFGSAVTTLATHGLTSLVAPSIFNPKQTNIDSTQPFNTGLQLVFSKLSGTQFEVILHALEEDVSTNTLSAPKIMALNNQEASILVGTKYPILKSEESTQAQYTVTRSLDYYQDIGIQLNVVPQISGDNYINMVIHPAVTASTTGVGSTASVYYPIITSREAETRILIKDGETVVIGGLLKDVESVSTLGIPLLQDIPILGKLFRRNTRDTEKIDLLIFITAHIVQENEFSAEAIGKLEERLQAGRQQKKAVVRKKKK